MSMNGPASGRLNLWRNKRALVSKLPLIVGTIVLAIRRHQSLVMLSLQINSMCNQVSPSLPFVIPIYVVKVTGYHLVSQVLKVDVL